MRLTLEDVRRAISGAGDVASLASLYQTALGYTPSGPLAIDQKIR